MEKNVLMSADQIRFRNRIYVQRRMGIDRQCHNEAYESDPLHRQSGTMSRGYPVWVRAQL